MSNVSVKINYEAVGEQLLKSEWIQGVIEEQASQIVSRAGEGYAYSTHNSGQRLITNIYPNSDEAAQDNYNNNTLLRSIR